MADKEKTKVKDSSGTFGELKTLVTDYAKQQTVDPLKNLGKWAAFGVGGGFMLTIGAFLSGLGVLRLLQQWSIMTKEENGVEVDAWTWLPYVLVALLLLAVAGACFVAMARTPDWMDDDA